MYMHHVRHRYHPGHPDGDWHVLWDTIQDPFMLAHLIGHFAHALILRDWVLCTVVSVGFEVLECSLQHILPNFQVQQNYGLMKVLQMTDWWY